MSTAVAVDRRSSLLPPRGLLLALLGQIPLVIVGWPLRPGPLEILAGCALLAAGVVLNVWSARLFERDAVGICPFSPAAALVTRGPYAVSRQPMYLGFVAIALGTTLVTGVLANLWAPATYAVWLHYAYVLPEERFLRDRFGAAYDAYRERVPRWLLVGR